MPRFEHDPGKSRSNEKRHGISLTEARRLWDEAHVLIPAKNVTGEKRFAILGKIKGKVHVAIFTERGEKLRLISCHRADKRWIKIYEKQAKE